MKKKFSLLAAITLLATNILSTNSVFTKRLTSFTINGGGVR